MAHVRQAKDGSFVVHDLDDHLRAVAELAARHASAMGGADWAQLAGLWHDLGKYAKEFQLASNPYLVTIPMLTSKSRSAA